MIDLHTHSTFSDGSLTPEELALQAKKIGLTAISLTDHDSVDGVEMLLKKCEEIAIQGIAGVEISVDTPKGNCHILGYFIDHYNKMLCEHLMELREGRKKRNEEILNKLNKLGLFLTMAEIEAFAVEGNVGRLHFALALEARGYVKNRDEAFEKYLGKGKAAYSERQKFTPIDGINIILQAGGLPVLAHPFTLEMSNKELEKEIALLKEAGLMGIEIYYPQHTLAQIEFYLALAKRYELLATGGTDFHGSSIPDIKLGVGYGNLNVPDELLVAIENAHKKFNSKKTI